VEKTMTFAAKDGRFFWSNGYAWGSCCLKISKKEAKVELLVLHGELTLSKFILRGFGEKQCDPRIQIKTGDTTMFTVGRSSGI
jgi:hypothetical protein